MDNDLFFYITVLTGAKAVFKHAIYRFFELFYRLKFHGFIYYVYTCAIIFYI